MAYIWCQVLKIIVLSYIYLKTAKICFLYISKNKTTSFCHNQFKLYVYFILSAGVKCSSFSFFFFFVLL